MDIDGLLEGLAMTYGVAYASIVPDDLWKRVCEEESTVRAADGSMEMENIGLEQCSQRTARICIFTRPFFEPSDDTGLSMVDEAGHTIGHSIPLCRMEEYRTMENVVFLSDDFILYTDREVVGQQRFVLTSIPYRGEGDWIPEEMDPVLWFPCPTSSNMLSEHFHQTERDLATGIIAVRL